MNFEYKIKKSKGRSIRISINKNAEVFLHVPRFVPEFVAKKFLMEKSDWVEKSLEKVKQTSPSLPFKKGRSIARKHYLENKESARTLVLEKLLFWKNYYKENFNTDFTWKNVSIKNSETRWGSCSSRKNLNFSYKIFFLESSAQDYLIVHELSHLIHMNHSKNFWNLVSCGIPDYKKQKEKLKKFRLLLN